MWDANVSFPSRLLTKTNQKLLFSYETNEIANTPVFALFYPPNGHFSASDRLGQEFFVAKTNFVILTRRILKGVPHEQGKLRQRIQLHHAICP